MRRMFFSPAPGVTFFSLLHSPVAGMMNDAVAVLGGMVYRGFQLTNWGDSAAGEKGVTGDQNHGRDATYMYTAATNNSQVATQQ